MRQPRAVVVSLMGDEDLRLVLQPPEGGRMDDTVAVALERRAGGALGFDVETPARRRRIARIGSARPVAETDTVERC